MANKHFLAWVERQGQALRQLARVSQMSPLNPHKLAQIMKVHVISPKDIPGIPQTILHQLLIKDHSSWSAGSLCLPNGDLIVVMNPTHANTRNRATLMEELAHIHLGHQPSQIINTDGGVAFRSFKKSKETEAFWVGAATLVTRSQLEDTRSKSITRGNLARKCGVSVALVKFRENVTGIRLQSG